jgi:chorismate mutase
MNGSPRQGEISNLRSIITQIDRELTRLETERRWHLDQLQQVEQEEARR